MEPQPHPPSEDLPPTEPPTEGLPTNMETLDEPEPLWRPGNSTAVCGLLLLAVLLVFGQTICHQFFDLDDADYVYQNAHVQGGLTGKAVAWAITTYHSCNWHPLTWLSHMLDCQLYHLNPRGHHLTNMLLHAAAAVLLFLALRRMTAALWPSAWVAAVFAIHPLRVESVAWIAERKDVLSGLLCMLCLWFYAGYAQRPASWGRYLLVVFSFALGLTAKPMLVTLPFVLLLLDYWPLRRWQGAASGEQRAGSSERTVRLLGCNLSVSRSLRFSWSHSSSPLPAPCSPLPAPCSRLPARLFIEKIPLFILAAASSAVTLAAQRNAMQPLQQWSFAGRVANAAVAYVAYLGKMLYPARLAVLYPLPENPPPAWQVAAAVGLLTTISVAVFLTRRKCPSLLVGWLWYLGTLVPVIGLVQVGSQAMADRYTYLTQIGLYMAIAWGAAELANLGAFRRWLLAAASALLLAGLIVCAWQQTRCWHDSETLWTHTLACTSRNPIACQDLGLALAGRGRFREAIPYYQEALKIKDDYLDAHNNLGLALANCGQVDAAIAQYRRAIEIEPGCAEPYNNLGTAFARRGEVVAAIAHYRKALELKPDYVEAHCNLGLALAGRGQLAEALAEYREALEIQPDCVQAHNNLANALAERGQVAEAITHYRQAVQIRPDFADAQNSLGVALAGRGQANEAVACFRKALAVQPDYAPARYNLANALADGGQLEEAIDQYRQALDIQPDLAPACYGLGLALAERGRTVEAAVQYRKALELARQQGNQDLVKTIQTKLRPPEAATPPRNSPRSPAKAPIQP